MQKIIMLLPTTYNDGRAMESEKIGRALSSIDSLIGGHTIDGECKGVYKMENGEYATDICLKIWAVCEDDKIPALQTLAGEFAVDMGQESIYFEQTPASVFFIRGK